jgi:hypothetical protein
MKIFVSMFMVLVLVMTTSFPSMSHAMMNHDAAKVEKVEVSEHGDCHGHKEAKQTQKTAQNDKDKCCDKGMCKCVGGNCHGMSKIFGNGNNSLAAVSTDSTVFAFDNQFVDSALPNRLKRPPKA